MNISAATEHWALWAAVVPSAIVLVVLVWTLYRRSSRGQLRKAKHNYHQAMKALDAGANSISRLQKKVDHLAARKDKVKPRVLQDARDALDDAQALHKILDDKMQVCAQQLRRVIFEEFPPAKHDSLRARYLPQDVVDKRPFNF